MTRRVGPIASKVQSNSNPTWLDYELMLSLTEVFTAGVLQQGTGKLQVLQHSTGNMSVDVAAGKALIPITNTNIDGTTYNVPFNNTALYNVPIATADATNPRIDIIVLRVDVSQDPDIGAGNIALIEVVQGTPAGSPAVPATPANSLKLAEIAVAAGAASIITANITDRRTYSTMRSDYGLDLPRQGLGNSLATVGGSANAITLTLNPAPSAYSAPMVIWFAATASNTGAVTVNINGLGSKGLKRVDGATALVSGDIKVGQLVCIGYDGAQFQMLTPSGNAPSQSVVLKYSNTADSNDISTGGGYTLVDFNTAYTIPANTLAVGMVFEMVAEGIVSTSSDLGVKFGVKVGSTIFTFNNSPISLPSAGGTYTWKITFRMICRSTGGSGTIECSGLFTCRKGSDLSEWKTELLVPDSTSTIDTTGSLVICPQSGWQTDTFTRHSKVKLMTVTQLV